jgi:hypothetical protein
MNKKRYLSTFAVISKAKITGALQITSQADLFSDQFDICLFQSHSAALPCYSGMWLWADISPYPMLIFEGHIG